MIYDLFKDNKLKKRDQEAVEFFSYFEKCIEAFPSCIIVTHFLYFETPDDKTNLYLSYLSLLISFASTSIPPKLAFKKSDEGGTTQYIIYSFNASTYVITNCILFGIVSTF
jgi:hypothetical protein